MNKNGDVFYKIVDDTVEVKLEIAIDVDEKNTMSLMIDRSGGFFMSQMELWFEILPKNWIKL